MYVAGASHDTGDDAFDYAILKYNATGTLQWQYIYAGSANKNDLPISIIPDDIGNVYVTGFSESASDAQDILTLKISSTGTLLWEARYDYNQLPDIPAGIELDNAGNVVVAGGSAVTPTAWEIVTLKYSITGTLLSETRVPSTTFDQPRALAKDGDGNFYITGQTGTGTTNPNLKLVKLDSNLNIVWEKTYDGSGKEDMGNSLAINGDGEVYVTGFTKNSDGSQDMLTLRYLSDGTASWTRVIKPLHPLGKAQGKKVAVDENGHVYIAGETQLNANPDMLVLGYDTSGFKQWHKVFTDNLNGVETPTSIVLDDDRGVLVTGILKTPSTSKNISVKYAPYERYRSVAFDSVGNPQYWKSQVIVGFGHNMVKKEGIDNKLKVHGGPYDFLDTSDVNQLYSKLGRVLWETKFVKIFPTIDSECNESKDRFGKVIPMPPFWSSLVLDFPAGTNVIPIIDSLYTLFPLVRYAHLNLAGDFSSNDPLFDEQASIHPTNGFNDGHINVEPAWDITTGDESVRVGFFDTGVEWRHEDYRWNQFSQTSSVVVAGWDFGNGVDMRNETLTNPNYKPDPKAGGHGTNVAGIIGAIRNNSTGVAGVSGGDRNAGTKGSSLYSLRILIESSDSVVNNYNDLSFLANAIILSGKSDCDTTFSYKLDIQNHSYGFGANQPQTTPKNIDLLKDAVRFAARSQVIIVAASGNTNSPDIERARIPDYPAALNDDWIINVGGSGTDLNWHPSAKIGGALDVVGPYPSGLTKSTLNKLNEYSNFGGTSSATPHVSGTAALMLANSGGMAPNDVEWVLKLTADDIDDPPAALGPDEHTGYGRQCLSSFKGH